MTGANTCVNFNLCCGADYGETCCNDIYPPHVYWMWSSVSTACDTDGGDFSALTGCAPRGTCADATCPTGYKDDASAASTLCASTVCDIAAADGATCCMLSESLTLTDYTALVCLVFQFL